MSAADEAAFTAVATALAEDPRVDAPSRTAMNNFGSKGLKVDGQIFAMMSKGRLVVKLPKERVAALVAAKEGQRYVLGARTMTEWVAIPASASRSWSALAAEALDFVARRATSGESAASRRPGPRPSSSRARASAPR
jgi:TfoX/Sxy family transcriptional regulator of competence genes